MIISDLNVDGECLNSTNRNDKQVLILTKFFEILIANERWNDVVGTHGISVRYTSFLKEV